MNAPAAEVLHEDNHCLALNKSAGLLTQADATGDPCLLEVARESLRVRHGKPGRAFVGLVHRLDRPVSGVVLFARTSKAASRLSEQFRDGTVRKTYWAVVEGRVEDDAGEWTDEIVKDETSNRSWVAKSGNLDAKRAILAFNVLSRERGKTLIEVRPATGRSHQIRVQLASRGLPILGDGKYGSKAIVPSLDGFRRIALHARKLNFRHPTRPEVICVTAPTPSDWPWRGSGT